MKKLVVLLTLMMPAVILTAATQAVCKTEMPRLLSAAGQKVTAEFDRMDAGLKKTAQILGTTGLTGAASRAALAKLCNDFDYAVDCAAIDLKGIMVTLEPAPFRKFEGKDISEQKQIKQIIQTGKPVLSDVFRAVEGFPAADAEYPVVTPDGQRLGSVSILFHPEKLLGKVLIPLLQGTPMDIWVMEKRGLILYDVHEQEIGLNLFTSRLYQPYAGLTALGRRIAARPEGTGVYEYLSGSSKQIVRKNAFWRSVSLYGAEWRLVAVHAEQKGAKQKTGIVVPATTIEQNLESLAASSIFIKALTSGDKTRGMMLFKDFFDNTPGIYSVQWVDETGINRFGYPQENSLNDYDFNLRRSVDDQSLLKIVAAGKPAQVEKPLLEGGIGICTFRPLLEKERYLGMVYFIRIKQ